MRTIVVLFLMLIVPFQGNSQHTVTFKVKKVPKLLNTLTTHSFFGKRGNSSANYQSYSKPMFIRLFADSTFMYFHSELVGDTLDKVYHYFSKTEGVQRGKFISNVSGGIRLEMIQGHYAIDIELKEVNACVGNTATIKKSYCFSMYKGALLRSFNSNVKPTLFPEGGGVDVLELYPVDVYYKLVELSANNQEALRRLYPELFEDEKESLDSTSQAVITQ